MKIQSNSLIELEYNISDVTGDVHESSRDDGPLEVRMGVEELPPRLEEALVGKVAGDEVQLTLAASEAFGEFDPEGLVTVPRADFPEDAELEPGLEIVLQIETDDGNEDEELETRVVEVNAEAVVLDANHPLAGKQVTFWVKVREVME